MASSTLSKKGRLLRSGFCTCKPLRIAEGKLARGSPGWIVTLTDSRWRIGRKQSGLQARPKNLPRLLHADRWMAFPGKWCPLRRDRERRARRRADERGEHDDRRECATQFSVLRQ